MSSDAANSSPERMLLFIIGKCTLQPSRALPVQLLLSAVPVGYIFDSSPFLQMLSWLYCSSEQSPETILVWLQYGSNQQFAQLYLTLVQLSLTASQLEGGNNMMLFRRPNSFLKTLRHKAEKHWLENAQDWL